MRWFLIGACLILGTVTLSQWWLWPVQLPQTTHADVPEKDKEQTLPTAVTLAPRAGHIGMVVGRRAEAELWRPLETWLRGLMSTS